MFVTWEKETLEITQTAITKRLLKYDLSKLWDKRQILKMNGLDLFILPWKAIYDDI